MNEALEIPITVHIESRDSVSSGMLIEILERISWAIYAAEADELDELFRSDIGIASVARDAMRWRLNQTSRNALLNIERAENGSLILFGIAAGLSYWLVDKTLGETVKETWVESESHARLKGFLKSRVFRKRDQIAAQIKEAYPRSEHAAAIAVEPARDTLGIVVTVKPDPEQHIPKPSELHKPLPPEAQGAR